MPPSLGAVGGESLDVNLASKIPTRTANVDIARIVIAGMTIERSPTRCFAAVSGPEVYHAHGTLPPSRKFHNPL